MLTKEPEPLAEPKKPAYKIVLFSRKFHPEYLRDNPTDFDLKPDDIPEEKLGLLVPKSSDKSDTSE